MHCSFRIRPAGGKPELASTDLSYSTCIATIPRALFNKESVSGRFVVEVLDLAMLMTLRLRGALRPQPPIAVSCNEDGGFLCWVVSSNAVEMQDLSARGCRSNAHEQRWNDCIVIVSAKVRADGRSNVSRLQGIHATDTPALFE